MLTQCAVFNLSRTLKVGLDKVMKVNNHWWEHKQPYKTTGDVRGQKVTKKDNRRRHLTQEPEDPLREFINDEHKTERRVFHRTHSVCRRTEADWMYTGHATRRL